MGRPGPVTDRLGPFLNLFNHYFLVRRIAHVADKFRLHRLTVDDQGLAQDLHRVARQADDTLDHHAVGMGMLEHHHFAALRRTGEKPAFAERQVTAEAERERIAPVSIGKLSDGHAVADFQCRHHAFGRNHALFVGKAGEQQERRRNDSQCGSPLLKLPFDLFPGGRRRRRLGLGVDLARHHNLKNPLARQS